MIPSLKVSYEFSQVWDDDSDPEISMKIRGDCMTYTEVTEAFLKFLSACYGYEITMEKLFDRMDIDPMRTNVDALVSAALTDTGDEESR